jgi:hypothetical protein
MMNKTGTALLTATEHYSEVAMCNRRGPVKYKL